jgi:hypothetical protein
MVAVEWGLADADLPGLFQSADTTSLRGQREYVNAVRLRLVLAVAAAVTGVMSWTVGTQRLDLVAFGTAIILTVMAAVELNLRSAKPEELWYDGRALAESAKSLAWRYSVGGLPFDKRGNERNTERLFVEQLEKLLGEAPTRSIPPSRCPVVSDRMRALRAADLDTRKAVYLANRIEDQQDWYSRKAAWNGVCARRWRVTLVVIETIGICAALIRGLGYVTIDLAGVVAAVIAAGAAWIGLRQHSTLARAYTFAANELSIAHAQLELADDEESWTREVGDAEEAVSREHTMWRASRSRAAE